MEVKFVRYLITEAGMIENLGIWFDDDEDCRWGAASETESLFFMTSLGFELFLFNVCGCMISCGLQFEPWVVCVSFNILCLAFSEFF